MLQFMIPLSILVPFQEMQTTQANLKVHHLLPTRQERVVRAPHEAREAREVNVDHRMMILLPVARRSHEPGEFSAVVHVNLQRSSWMVFERWFFFGILWYIDTSSSKKLVVGGHRY